MEKREFKRLPAETEVNIREVSIQAQTLSQATCKNISGGGILLSSSQRYEPGVILDIEVMTPTHRSFRRIFRPLLARIRVVRTEGEAPPFDIAAEFITVEK